jgi:DNA adenine methylase
MTDQLSFDGFLESRLPPPKHAKTVLKWLGGKSWMIKLASQGIYRHLARTGGRYVEPFLGGAALALDLGLPDMLLSDSNTHLIATYQTIRDQPEQVAWALSSLASQGIDEQSYYRVRDATYSSRILMAARFIYLNKLCFNGVYRENKKGEFNVPYGDNAYRKSVVGRKVNDRVDNLFPSGKKLRDLAQAFATAELEDYDFRDAIEMAGEGDLVYADPPYAKTFDAYTAEGFGPQDQIDLVNALGEAWERGATILTTNADQPEIRDMYSWATIMTTAEARSVSQDGSKRKRVGCVLVISPGDELILGT